MNPHKKKSFLFCFLVLYANIGKFFFTLFTSFNSHLFAFLYLFIYLFIYLYFYISLQTFCQVFKKCFWSFGILNHLQLSKWQLSK
jgi:hypothetical protein